MRKMALWACAALMAAAGFSGASAQDVLSPSRFALGVGVGTNGGLVEGSYKLTPQIILRGQGAFLDFSDGFNSDDTKYSGRAHFNTGGGFLDWHPFSNAWLLSAGAVVGERKVDLKARPTANGVTIDGVLYSLTEIGAVNGEADFGSPAPFVGLGWDNTFYTVHKIGFRAVAGVIFGGDPKLNLQAIGPYATNPIVVSDVQAEQASLTHDIRDYQYYPVVQVGLNYRF